MNVSKILNTKAGRLAIAGVVAVGAVVGISVAANGAVKPDCKTLSYPLCPRSVAASQVVDNSLPKTKIVPADRDAFLKDTDVKGDAQVNKSFAATKITNIGGSFSTRHTVVGSFTLPKGTWLVNLSGKFNRTTASASGDPAVQPMLQLLAGTTELGTIMGNDISPGLDADLTGTSLRLITVDADTVVEVEAFGYNSARGSQGSGEITAAATVVAVRA
ncbi:hypothetical protein AB0L70_17840 [Kribbella sp. NPDC051952]|uniref:hypothetical protein n=1 Tax=Kribbella sp. NPDC051952 TaxID=3154851 RepID=UPI003428EEA2